MSNFDKFHELVLTNVIGGWTKKRDEWTGSGRDYRIIYPSGLVSTTSGSFEFCYWQEREMGWYLSDYYAEWSQPFPRS